MFQFGLVLLILTFYIFSISADETFSQYMFHTDHNPLMTNSNVRNVSTDGEIAWSVSGFSNGQEIGGAVVTNPAANNDDFYWTQGTFIMAGTYPNNNAANGEKAVIKWTYSTVGLIGESTPAVSTDGENSIRAW